MKSWRTTLVGLVTFIVAVGTGILALMDDDPATTFDMAKILTALAGIGFMASRDNNVSSEKAGAK